MPHGLPPGVVRILMPTPFPVGPVNAYLVLDDPPYLVDTGPNTPDSWLAMTSSLCEAGCAPEELEAVYATHGHMDHVGLLGRLQEQADLPCWAHPYVAPFSGKHEETEAGTVAYATELLLELGAPADEVEACMAERKGYREYSGDYAITHTYRDRGRAGPFQARFTPGHSPSDVVLLDSGKGVVFCGDHVLESVNPVPLLRRPGPDGERPPSLVQYVESLRASRRVDAEVWLPGHGEVIRDHRGAIDRLLERFQSRAAQALDALKQGPKTPYGLARDQSRRFDPRHLYIAVSLATGLLELLEHEGRARSWRDNGLLYYEAI